jgi:DNA mismatch repair ATPase MutS
MVSGIELARLADLPANVLAEANRVAEKLSARQTQSEESSESHKVSVRRKALLRVVFDCAVRCAGLLIIVVSAPHATNSGL